MNAVSAEFHAGVESASNYAQRQQWRQSADAYRNIYLSVTSRPSYPFNGMHYFALSGWTSILVYEQAKPCQEDLACLERLAKTPPSDVSLAEWSTVNVNLGILYWIAGHRDKAAHLYRKILSYHPTEAQTSPMVLDGMNKTKSSGEIFENHYETAKTNLAAMQGVPIPPPTPQELADIAELRGMGGPSSGAGVEDTRARRTYTVRVGEEAPLEVNEAVKQRLQQAILRVGGQACDCCGGLRGEGKVLLRCSVCHNRWYCSAACQKKHWMAHKKACRAPNDFHAGDYVRIEGIAAEPELNGTIAEVRNVGAEGRWMVAAIGGYRVMSIRRDKLLLVVAAEDVELLLRGG